MRYNIKFSPPDISESEIKEVEKVMRSGWITTGPETKMFEKQIADFCNTKKAVCLNSATACMELTLRLLGIGEGDEVITSAYTYTASCSVICHVGAKPVLVDTAKDSFQMDYDKLKSAITSKTKAIIAVDLGGVVCDYDKIYSAVEDKKSLFTPKNNLQKAIGRVAVIADAAHAFGALYDGKRCGEVADFTSFSFHAVKNLTTAEGGAVTWRQIDGFDDEEIYRQYMLMSLHGQTKDALSKTKIGSWEYDIISPAYKCNMTDIMAAIGVAQLRRYNDLLCRRREVVQMYNKGLSSLNLQILDHFCTTNSESSKHLYITRLLGKDDRFRNRFIEKMAEKGISTNVHYKPLPMLTAYKNLGFDINQFKNAYEMYENEVTLPLHTLLTDDEIQYIIMSFKECLEEK